jgi:short-subunit dehydrogenase
MKKVSIITGASSGIGLACAREFVSQNFAVVLAARNLEKLTEIHSEITSTGGEVLIVKADVSIEDDCRNIINETLNRFGRIDVLVNNAGISMRALFHDLDLKVLHSLMNTNFWGTVYCTKYALPQILQTNGSIIGISSIAGFMGLPGRTGYSASKFAMQGFLETVRVEHLKDKLHVMIVAPGFTASNIRNTALNASGNMQGESPRNEGKMMTSEEVARHIFKGIIKRKRLLVLTTQGKLAVFLRKFIPSVIDRIEYKMMKNEPNSPLK